MAYNRQTGKQNPVTQALGGRLSWGDFIAAANPMTFPNVILKKGTEFWYGKAKEVEAKTGIIKSASAAAGAEVGKAFKGLIYAGVIVGVGFIGYKYISAKAVAFAIRK